MTEIRTACPKCGGQMLFPPELAGQEAACPLCGKTITLPKRKRTSVRGVTSAVAVAGCLLTAALIWQHHTKRAGSSPSRSVNDSSMPTRALRERASKGDIEAQVALGLRYDNGGRGAPQDWLEAYNWWDKAASKGSAEAQFHLSRMYASGKWVKKDEVKAFQWLSKSAEKGHAAAQFELAECYEQGLGVTREKKRAAKWRSKAFNSFTWAAQKGDADAQCSLGGMYSSGKAGEEDPAKAFHWFLKSAQQDNAAAQLRVAEAYDQGLGVAQDKAEAAHWYAKAFTSLNKEAKQGSTGALYVRAIVSVQKNTAPAYHQWLLQSAQQGDADAQYRLGQTYENGLGVNTDPSQAVAWYNKAFASYSSVAAQGDGDAQLSLGLMYQRGEGMDTNASKAVEWLAKAADQGNERARLYLENMRRSETSAGMSEETKQLLFKSLFSCYLKVAGEGDLDAQFELAEAYQKGLGTHQDTGEAGRWYATAVESAIKAADAGDKSAQLRQLPHMLSNCKEIPKGTKELLFGWFVKRAQGGDTKAQTEVARAYREGLCVPQDRAEAVRWYMKAAEQGDSWARSELEYPLLKATSRAAGDAVHGEEDWQELEQVFKWFLRLAQQGDAKGQCHLADMYAKGLGVAQNKAEAVGWYIKSAEQTNEFAESALGHMFFRDVERAQTTPPKDPKQVESLFRWFLKLAQRGDAEAQRKVAFAYAEGLGVTADKAQALRWFIEAGNRGNVEAQSTLGCMYRDGNGVQENKTEAVKWFIRVADSGHMTCAPVAVQYMSIMSAYDSLESDARKLVVEWFRNAAAQGDKYAQYRLGTMYRDGEGVLKDAQEAFSWLLKSAQQGDVNAQFDVGYAYEAGLGVLQDTREAITWYRKSASNGGKLAQRRLGLICEQLGSAELRIEAHKWFNLAAAQGDEKSAADRNRLERRMTAQEVAEANRQAKALSDEHKPTE